jgi:phenylalanine-4-hydroxylase
MDPLQVFIDELISKVEFFDRVNFDAIFSHGQYSQASGADQHADFWIVLTDEQKSHVKAIAKEEYIAGIQTVLFSLRESILQKHGATIEMKRNNLDPDELLESRLMGVSWEEL